MVLQYLSGHKLRAVLFENALLLFCALYESVVLRGAASLDFDYIVVALARAMAFAAAIQIALHLRDVYDFRPGRPMLRFVSRLVQGIGLGFLSIWVIYLALPGLNPAPDGLPLLFLRVSSCLGIWHFLLRLYWRRLARRQTVLIMGTGLLARAVATEIVRRPELGMTVCGFLDDNPSLIGVSIVNPKVIGLHSDLNKIISQQPVRKIVVELPDRRGRLPVKELLDLKTRGVSIEDATSLYERLTGKVAVENLKASWMIFSDGFEAPKLVTLQKNILSIAVSIVLGIVFLPILPLVALLIKLDSKGPVFHGQERVGRHGKVFKLWKFRSMRQDAERLSGPVWAGAADSRASRVGKYLRRTRIDELPQLYNVLKGDMSLVGPRPERPYFVEQLSEIVPFYHVRHAVKPGVTGWAQINYRYGNSVEDALEKQQYDLFYIKNISVLLDAVIVFDTIKTVLVRKGS